MYMRILIPFLCPTLSLAQSGKLGVKDKLIAGDSYYM